LSLAILLNILSKAWKLLFNPLTWIAILAGTSLLFGGLWRSQTATTARVRASCEATAQAALREGLEQQAAAWASIYQASQEAVTRMAMAQAQSEANARNWRNRYEQALKQPACAEWSKATVMCPVE
jgi:hypothetical protein